MTKSSLTQFGKAVQVVPLTPARPAAQPPRLSADGAEKEKPPTDTDCETDVTWASRQELEEG